MDATEPEITFLFQFGNIRDTQRVPLTALNLKDLKDLAVDFINHKVSGFAKNNIAECERLESRKLPEEAMIGII